MAEVTKQLRPRRGKKSTMNGTKKTTVLASGEIFIEVPDTGVGKGHSCIKIGDGTTEYSSLPYALGDTQNDQIEFAENGSTDVTSALNAATSGKKLSELIGALKKAISLANTTITKLNDDWPSVKDLLDKQQSGELGMTEEQNTYLKEIYDYITETKNGAFKAYYVGSTGYSYGYASRSHSVTLDCTSIPNYQNLTILNFCAYNIFGAGWHHQGNDTASYEAKADAKFSYSQETGKLTVSGLTKTQDKCSGGCGFDIYCVPGVEFTH